MKIIVTENYEELGKVASQHLLGHMFSTKNRVNLSITAGTTPFEVYKYLVPEVKDRVYLKNVHYYNFDEIPYKDNKQEGITIRDLRHLYFNPANISEESIHPLDILNFKDQDKKIENAGGLDAVLLGVGADGHYCGNLPGTTTINDYTTEVICDEVLKQKIGRHFENKEDVPDSYVTMGPKSIMSAKQLILIANGRKKADIMKKIIEEDIDLSLPVTILKMHPNLTIILDKAAASQLNGEY